jgi:hypothetical protein
MPAAANAEGHAGTKGILSLGALGEGTKGPLHPLARHPFLLPRSASVRTCCTIRCHVPFTRIDTAAIGTLHR